MDLSRVYHSLVMCLILSPMKRAEYLDKNRILFHVGKNCMVMFRKIPLHPELISLGNNVWIASNVTLITHDVIHHMLNYIIQKKEYSENIGCIDIKDNVFIGANTTVLPNVTIGPNTIVGAGSLVNRSIGEGVFAGVPAKYICSWDAFIEKRKQYPEIVIETDKKGMLSDKTIKTCWERLYKRDRE